MIMHCILLIDSILFCVVERNWWSFVVQNVWICSARECTNAPPPPAAPFQLFPLLPQLPLPSGVVIQSKVEVDK